MEWTDNDIKFWYILGASLASGSSFWNTKDGSSNKELVDTNSDDSEVSIDLGRSGNTVSITRRTRDGRR